MTKKKNIRTLTWVYGGPRTGHHFVANFINLSSPAKCLMKNETHGLIFSDNEIDDEEYGWYTRSIDDRGTVDISYLGGGGHQHIEHVDDDHDYILLLESWTVNSLRDQLENLKNSKKAANITTEFKYCAIRNPICVLASAVAHPSGGEDVQKVLNILMAGHEAVRLVKEEAWKPIFYDLLLDKGRDTMTEYGHEILAHHCSLIDRPLPPDINTMFRGMQINTTPNTSFWVELGMTGLIGVRQGFTKRWECPEAKASACFKSLLPLAESLAKEVSALMLEHADGRHLHE